MEIKSIACVIRLHGANTQTSTPLSVSSNTGLHCGLGGRLECPGLKNVGTTLAPIDLDMGTKPLRQCLYYHLVLCSTEESLKNGV